MKHAAALLNVLSSGDYALDALMWKDGKIILHWRAYGSLINI